MKGALASEGSSGESVSHFAAIRVRMNGTGNLQMTAKSLNDVRSKTLVPLAMTPLMRFAPTRLVNFVEQRVSFTISTNTIDEQFKINRIIIFTKEIYSSYPGS